MRSAKSTLKKIKGDASFRSFYRKTDNKKNSIIVYAKKEKEKNLLIYDAINSLLIENKINLYKKAIDLLSKIQKIKQKKIKNFNGKNYKIPIYESNKLFKETKLFSNWYAKKYISKKKLSLLNIEINIQIKFLLSNIKLKNDTLVHRDFHVSNLMKYKKEVAIIDTQDALIGNRVYDLASLIDDVRFKSNQKLKDTIYNYYLKLNKKKINKDIFLNDFEILSVIRNMKIIGVFSRLAVRDKKKKYLKLIPYAWKLIELRIKNNQIFNGLKRTLDLNFSKKIRNLK